MFHRPHKTAMSRWKLVEWIFSHWHGALTKKDGVSSAALDRAEKRLGISLPSHLRTWYRLAGARHDVWSTNDHFYAPDRLEIEGDVLIFCVENQSAVRWGIRLSDCRLKDPPVVIDVRVLRSDGKNGPCWVIEADTTSEFAVHMLLHATMMRCSGPKRWSGNGPSSKETLQIIRRKYSRSPFRDWHWPTYPTRFFVKDDIIIEVENASFWVWVTAHSEDVFQEFEAAIERAQISWQSHPDW